MDVAHHFALVACLLENGCETPLGLGEYFITDKDPQSAELAFAVEEEYQELGVGTALLRHLAMIAQNAGVEEFTAFVHPENNKMLEVFAHSGFPVSSHNVFAAVQLRLKLCKTEPIACSATEVA